MLNGYKLIAVCLTKIQDEVTYEFIDALYQTVKGSDYRLLLFNSFSDLYHQNVYDEGAKSIYQLLNYCKGKGKTDSGHSVKYEGGRLLFYCALL